MSPAKKHGTRSRPRRSVLYMPSSNERALEKAKSLPCDALILDLEDAVAPDAKEAAREAACAAVKSGEYGRKELIIRVNALGTDDTCKSAAPPPVNWNCANSAYNGQQYWTCSGGDIYKCENGVPKVVECNNGCKSNPLGTNDVCL